MHLIAHVMNQNITQEYLNSVAQYVNPTKHHTPSVKDLVNISQKSIWVAEGVLVVYTFT